MKTDTTLNVGDVVMINLPIRTHNLACMYPEGVRQYDLRACKVSRVICDDDHKDLQSAFELDGVVSDAGVPYWFDRQSLVKLQMNDDGLSAEME